MSSSELNSFELNTDRLVRLPALVLDSGALDQSTFTGSGYNAGDLTYDTATATYSGALTQFANASASLGGLTASVSATPSVIVSASSEFGSFTGTATSSVAHISTASGEFGGLSATVTSGVTNYATANADLGAITASATANVSNLVSASAQLGAIQAEITATVTHIAQAESQFGTMQANANTLPTVLPLFTAELGGLSANANATVTPVVPPTPEPQSYGSNRPYASPQSPKKVEPLPEPPKVVITETEPARPVRMPANIVAKAYTNTIVPTIEAQSQIEWSILADEAELLLLI